MARCNLSPPIPKVSSLYRRRVRSKARFISEWGILVGLLVNFVSLRDMGGATEMF